MGVVGGGHSDGVELLLLEHLARIFVAGGVGKFVEGRFDIETPAVMDYLSIRKIRSMPVTLSR